MRSDFRSWVDGWVRRDNAKYTWHMWFAWHPIKMKPGWYLWLEWVQRQKVQDFPFNWYLYRLPDKDKQIEMEKRIDAWKSTND